MYWMIFWQPSLNAKWKFPWQIYPLRGVIQCFLNKFFYLLDNAYKFTRKCEVTQIEIGFFLRDGQNAYFIRDNGVGFDMKYAEKLFGVFQRLHPANEFEGTGIGLANVRRIILRHGGKVWADARVGQGATFYFTLPPSDKVK